MKIIIEKIKKTIWKIAKTKFGSIDIKVNVLNAIIKYRMRSEL